MLMHLFQALGEEDAVEFLLGGGPDTPEAYAVAEEEAFTPELPPEADAVAEEETTIPEPVPEADAMAEEEIPAPEPASEADREMSAPEPA